MAAALVQSAHAEATTIAYGSPVTVGNLLVACISAKNSSDVISITDSSSNTWTKAVSLQESVGGSYTAAVNAAIFYAVANGNTTPTITIGNSAGNDPGGVILEYSGLSNVLDGTPTSANVATTTTPTANSLTTTTTDVIIAMCAQEQAGGTFSASTSPFTLQASNGGHVDGTSDNQNAVAGAYACRFNFSATSPWIVLQAAFKVTSGAVNKGKFLMFM